MSCLKDVKLRSDGSVYCFKYLGWDTEFFGKRSFALDAQNSILKRSDRMKRLIGEKFAGVFITAKLDSTIDKDLLAFLQDTGFKYIDTEITLGYNGSLSIDSVLPRFLEIEKLKENKDIPYRELGSAFSLTRFHSDTNIPLRKANRLWIEYLKNFRPSAHNHLFRARYRKEVAGVILVNEICEENKAMLFFVAVRNGFRGKGIGTALIQAVVNAMKGRELTVGTQAKNIGALNFYIKNGFSVIKDCKIVLHRWGLGRLKRVRK